jgi:soluble lytic murein transglycosylase-like protein
MEFMNRIQDIQMKMSELQSRFTEAPTPARQRFSIDSMQVAPPQSFQQILAREQGLDQLYAPPPLPACEPPPAGFTSAQFNDLIREASMKYGVEESLIRAVIQQESGFNPRATSGVGAMWLMQLMPGTARELGVSDAYDPRQNIMGGAQYLRKLLDRFNGDVTKAVAGYNAGPGAVEKHGGIPPYKETQNYVRKVLGYYTSMRQGV